MDWLFKYLYYLVMPEVEMELPEGVELVVGPSAGVVTCERDWSWSPSPLADYDLWIVLGGNGELTVNGHTHVLSAGFSYILRPGSSLQGWHDPAHRLRVLYCHFQLVGMGHAVLGDASACWPADPVMLHDVPHVETLGKILLQGLRQADAVGARTAQLALRQLLLQRILDARVPLQVRSDTRITRVLGAIQNQPEQPWQLATMAQVAHLSISQFRRLFHLVTGLSPNAYLVQERVARARKLLVESDLPLAVIADTLGYRDIYYFNRQFRQVAGTPPGAYRRAYRG
jgi:AraC family transcriptional regulator, arabinose operon regulatory protein